MNFVLIGYRGTGKTSAGRAAAGSLGMPFYDTDEMIKKETGKTVGEIVEAGGWTTFRIREKEAVRKLPKSGDNIIALGGGAVLDPENIEELKRRKSAFIWLFADPAVISQRIEGDSNSAGQRPSFNGPAGPSDDIIGITSIIRERTPVYRGLADYLIDTSDRGVGEIAGSICRFIKSCGER